MTIGTRARAAAMGFCAAILGILLPLAAWTASAKAESDRGLTTTVEVERTHVLAGQAQTIYVLVRFEAPDFEIASSQRPPLNLSLVLDRSGSMADKGKIEYLREAAKLAVGRLERRDVVSVVEFDDQITLMWPAGQVRDTGRLSRLIDGLTPRGSTNLTGGMMRGVEETLDTSERLRRSGMLDRVIVLSDGLANVGVTDPREIGRLVRGARAKGVRISTVGLGRDYDEDLMQAIAENGAGKYYYVEHPTQLARIFEEELKTIFATACREVRIEFHGASGVRAVEIVGYAQGTGGTAATDWPDFHAGETRGVLLRLDVETGASGTQELGEFAVNWKDAKSGTERRAVQPVRVALTRDRDTAERSINKDVAVEAALVESERALEANVKLFEAGKYDEAQAANEAVKTELKARNASLKDERLARKLEALEVEQDQMTAAAAAPETSAGYLKATKQRLYQSKSGKRSGYVLRVGDRGLEVERLQQALKDAGFYTGDIDGTFDTDVKSALEAYQNAQNLDVDGVAGASTQQKLGLY